MMGARKTAIDPAFIALIRELQTPDDPDLLAQVVKLFLDTLPERLARILSAEGGEDLTILRLEALSLRSSAANLGAARLAQICGDLGAGGGPLRTQLFAELRAEVESVREELQRIPEVQRRGRVWRARV